MKQRLAMGRLLGAITAGSVLVALVPMAALAHGDVRLVDETFTLDPGAASTFAGEIHYHRLVGEMASDGPVRVSLLNTRTGEETLAFAPGTDRAFNELVRCCDQVWAPHELVVENVANRQVTVTIRARLVHDDLAVMVDGAESGTRLAIVLLAFGWWAVVRRTAKRVGARVPLGVPAVGLAVLAAAVVAVGGYAFMRYGVGGAPAVVAGTADIPILGVNPVVSRASLMMGLSMLGWALVGVLWIRARDDADSRLWSALGVVSIGVVVMVGVAVTLAYGGPLVQTAWVVGAAAPIVATLARPRRHVA